MSAIPSCPAMEDVRRRIRACNECGLGSPRVNEVLGDGPTRCPLMFVGEAPGEPDESSGRPFVGRAGKYLMRVLRKLGILRKQVYITNILKHRPPDNRTPGEDELRTCMMHLNKEIAIVRPKVVCSLGGIATRTILRSEARFYDLRGRTWRKGRIRILPTFHPAYILRSPGNRDLFEDDLRTACVGAGLLKSANLFMKENVMADQEIRSKTGKLLGKVRQLSNGKFEGRLATGKLVGTFDPKSNSTVDFRGRTVGKGNLLASLITGGS